MNVLLLSTYELGRHPFGLASAAAWLREAGHQVRCADLAVEPLPAQAAREARLVAIHLAMHTATRLAAPVIERLRRLNPSAHLLCFGLYAPLNENYLRGLGVHSIIGGEFEPELTALANRLALGAGPVPIPLITLDRVQFRTPCRDGLAPLDRYARLLVNGEARLVGYTEASRGCKHRCRHCPVVPVYNGRFRVVQADVVLADIRQQVAAGARHITFGDPDFFNGPAHARRIVTGLHREFPGLTYDVTAKIEHLLLHRDLLPVLKQTGCAFLTSAVESLDDAVLRKLEKGHTQADFLTAARLLRELDLPLSPTFIPFTPWTTMDGYRDLLRVLVEEDLVSNTGSVQLALRLLIPAGSRLLELDEIRGTLDGFDAAALCHRWRHPDPAVDALAQTLLRMVDERQKAGATRQEIFAAVWEAACGRPPDTSALRPRATIPYLNEPWYC